MEVMDAQIIETDRLRLSPFVRGDAADVFTYASNPNVSRFTTWSTHRNLADSHAFIEMVMQRPAHQHAWAIRTRFSPVVVGAIEFGLHSSAEADFHYVLAEPLWNQGLMTEAGRAVISWGLKRYPEVMRVFSLAMSKNVPSQRVMEKCGLRFERIRIDRWEKFADPVELREYAFMRNALKTG